MGFYFPPQSVPLAALVGVSDHFVLNPEPEWGSHWHPGTLPLHIFKCSSPYG